MHTQPNVKRIKRNEAILVLIDLQERLLPAMHGGEERIALSARLIRGCRVLGTPVLATQQYTRGLGATVGEVALALTEALPADKDGAGAVPAADFVPVEKTSFSAMGEPEFARRLKESGKRSVLVCGVEAHVCVLQTVLDLLAAGFDAFFVSDLISSRKRGDAEAAFRRMAAAGAVETTYESVLFELLEGAGKSGFKQISGLVK
ncbi:MAG: isochorismatase family protein [Clostridiales Family XIII bacterium]|jgi:nicotinamidase-related amidase|nr:isochorismatase family protein [Clostridiales Family XIII bacterium]